jgi:hypothetical protein
MTRRRTVWLTSLLLCCCNAALGQDPQAAKLLEAQKEAMKKLAFMDGVWRGPAWTTTPTGKHHITQTERIGPFLGGTIKVIEGKGYEPDGTSSFNALGIISYDVTKKTYSMRSYAMGRSGDYPVTLTDDGFRWEIPAGPGMTIRYTATVKDGTWKEVGDRVASGKTPVRFFEMELKRVGDSSWPVEGTIQPK